MPFYPSPLRDDGYDISDFCNIAAPYGTLDDFKAVIDALHERNIKVVTDLVVNHSSDQHPWFLESRSSKHNPKRQWYVWSESNQRYPEARIIFLDTEESNWAFDPETGEYYWHRFYKEQPDLNYDNPEVEAAMLDVMRFWLDFGIDGFRVDAVPYLVEREGTNCENLPETHHILKRVREMVNTEYPGRILLAEANQWPQELLPYLDEEFDMAFHFPIMPRLFMALRQGNRREIVHILNQTPEIPSRTQWCMFLRNHDELTLEMVTEAQRQWMWNEYAPQDRMRINLGIRRRLAPLLDNDRRKILMMNALVFSLNGSPILYYGDEIGMGDNIWLDDRNGVRTPMQWDSSKNGGFSVSDKTYEPVVDDEIFGYQQVNVATQKDDPQSLFSAIRHQINVRKANPVFGRGGFRMLEVENESVFVCERCCNDEDQDVVVVVAANLTNEQQVIKLEETAYGGSSPYDLLTDQAYSPIGDRAYSLTLEPYQCVWLKLES
jgi:maltose alpha-D-glucosyltransferase/alpha-amylase